MNVSQLNDTPLNGLGRFAHIDAMRAYAVGLVVVAHAGLGHVVPGGSGVTVFFAISGFIITRLLLRERDKTGSFDIRHFYWRRVLKLAPPFILVVAIPTLVVALFDRIEATAFLAQVFFFFNWYYMEFGPAGVLPGSGVVWSLSIEEQFYVAFAVFWFLAIRSRHAMLWVAAVGLVAATGPLVTRLIISATQFSHERTYYGTDTRIDGIAIGVLAAVVYQQITERQRWPRLSALLAADGVLIAAVLVYLGTLGYRDEFFRETFRYSLQAGAAALVILYGLLPGHGPIRRVFNHVNSLRAIQVIGLASYSIYLVHLTMAWVVDWALPGIPLVASVVLKATVGTGVGVVIWRVVERPIALRAASSRPSTQVSSLRAASTDPDQRTRPKGGTS